MQIYVEISQKKLNFYFGAKCSKMFSANQLRLTVSHQRRGVFRTEQKFIERKEKLIKQEKKTAKSTGILKKY